MKRFPHDRSPEKRSAIGHLILVLFIPGARSLKDKRQVLQSLVSRTRDRFPVSVAETGYQDLWQRSVVEAVIISSDPDLPGKVFEKILELFRSDPAVDVQDAHQEFL